MKMENWNEYKDTRTRKRLGQNEKRSIDEDENDSDSNFVEAKTYNIITLRKWRK